MMTNYKAYSDTVKKAFAFTGSKNFVESNTTTGNAAMAVLHSDPGATVMLNCPDQGYYDMWYLLTNKPRTFLELLDRVKITPAEYKQQENVLTSASASISRDNRGFAAFYLSKFKKTDNELKSGKFSTRKHIREKAGYIAKNASRITVTGMDDIQSLVASVEKIPGSFLYLNNDNASKVVDIKDEREALKNAKAPFLKICTYNGAIEEMYKRYSRRIIENGKDKDILIIGNQKTMSSYTRFKEYESAPTQIMLSSKKEKDDLFISLKGKGYDIAYNKAHRVVLKLDGKKLIELRKKKGFSQRQMAVASKISQHTICFWELERENASLESAISIANTLQVSVYDIVKKAEMPVQDIKVKTLPEAQTAVTDSVPSEIKSSDTEQISSKKDAVSQQGTKGSTDNQNDNAMNQPASMSQEVIEALETLHKLSMSLAYHQEYIPIMEAILKGGDKAKLIRLAMTVPDEKAGLVKAMIEAAVKS